MNQDEQDLPYEEGQWVALTEPYSSPYLIPCRVGSEPTVPFGAIGKIVIVVGDPHEVKRYNIAFHAGWMVLDVPHKLLRPTRMLEQLALCADGC